MIKTIIFNKKLNIQLIILLVFYFISFISNVFPKGYVIAGGDFYQLFNIQENIHKYFYTWTNQSGQGHFFIATPSFFYYSILLLPELLGFTTNNIASVYMFIYLIGSFYSFYFGMKILFGKNINYLASILCSLIY